MLFEARYALDDEHRAWWDTERAAVILLVPANELLPFLFGDNQALMSLRATLMGRAYREVVQSTVVSSTMGSHRGTAAIELIVTPHPDI